MTAAQDVLADAMKNYNTIWLTREESEVVIPDDAVVIPSAEGLRRALEEQSLHN
jgi:hypothetical protein